MVEDRSGDIRPRRTPSPGSSDRRWRFHHCLSAARGQIVIEEMAELPDPGGAADPDNDDDVPNTVVYKGVRLYIDPDKARRRGGDGTTRRAG